MAGTAPEALFTPEPPKQAFRAMLKARAAGEVVGITVAGMPHVCRVEPKQGRRCYVFDYMTGSIKRLSGETLTSRLKPGLLALPESELKQLASACRKAKLQLDKLRAEDWRRQCHDDCNEDPDGAKLSVDIQTAKLELQAAYSALAKAGQQ